MLAAARLSACARSSFADRALRGLGIDQLVVVGAGLDTTFQRRHKQFGGRAWLVDLPGMLAWREELFGRAGVADFALSVAADLRDGLSLHLLERAGFDASAAHAHAVAAMTSEDGEPWLCTTTTPSEIGRWLAETGWQTDQDVAEASVAPPEFWDRQAHLKPMTLIRLVQAARRDESQPA